jgi:hypothetical protein
MFLEKIPVIVADTFAALIARDPWLAGIPVLTERKGDIGGAVTQALKKLGLCVAVIMPDCDSLQSRNDGFSVRLRLVAEITELVLVNQSAPGNYRPALSAAWRVMAAVAGKHNGVGDAGLMRPRGLNEFSLPPDAAFSLVPDPTFVVYHVTALTTVLARN